MKASLGHCHSSLAEEHEDRLFRVLGIVGGLGFWEAWRLPLVCRELRFRFSGGGAPADMIKLGLERRGVWTKLCEARAARREWNGLTMLYNACCVDRDENVQRVSELLELGWPGSIEERGYNGDTPLIDSSRRGRVGIMKVLLAAGADVTMTSNGGMTSLIYACYFGRLEAARLLVAATSFVNARDIYGNTPLSCSRGCYDAIADPAIEALLLAAGATAV